MLQRRSVLLAFFSCLLLVNNVAIGQSGSSRSDTLLNTEHYLITGSATGILQIVKEGHQGEFPSYNLLAKYKDDLILGKNIDFDDVNIYKRHKPIASFEDYEVDFFNGKLAAPNFESSPGSKNFITRIKAACEGGINFAGHYTLVEWGCGTACQTGVLVDRKTGEIHNRPTSSLGTDFKPDSNLIIFNIGAIDTNTNLIWVSGHSEVSFEIWKQNGFIQIQ